MATRSREHHYSVRTTWTGNTGSGTSSYKAYDRSIDVHVEGKPVIQASADKTFRGDPGRWNPEDFLLAALSECHMLSYLSLAAARGVNVVAYADEATATMVTHADGSGEFVEATLHPVVTVADESMITAAEALHEAANRVCFIARSVDFPVHHVPTTRVG